MTQDSIVVDDAGLIVLRSPGVLPRRLMLSLLMTLLERPSRRLPLDVHAKLSQIQTGILQSGLQPVLSVHQKLPHLRPVGCDMGMNYVVGHRHADVHASQVRLCHLERDGP